MVVCENFKKVLMISYAFPPMGGSGVQRTLKFVKYLPQFGWEPIILTVKKDGSGVMPEYDSNFLNELPKTVKVHRTTSMDISMIRKAPRFLNTSQKHDRLIKNSQKTKNGKFYVSSILKKFKAVIYTWILIPDDKIGWLPFALAKAYRLIKQHDIDLIYTTSNPYTDHLIGYILKKITGKPWVADFRDPWIDNIVHSKRYYDAPLGGLRKNIDSVLEKVTIKNADHIIGTTDPTADTFRKRYPSVDVSKFSTITNGYDDEDFKKIMHRGKNDQKYFTICYSGSFRRVSPLNFLTALRNLLAEKEFLRNKIKVILVGLAESKIREQIAGLKLETNVHFVGYVPHQQSIEYLLNSNILLLLMNSDIRDRLIMPGKIFEYLAAQKPILAIISPGPAADLINAASAGKIVDPDDINAIKNAIYAFYLSFEKSELSDPVYDQLYRYERKYLTKKLSQLFDDIFEKEVSNEI